MADSYVVGVDGGTTKTIALVADMRGRIRGAGRRGNSNWSGEDVDVPMAVVVEAVREALAQAGVRGEEVAAGAFCLAGADWPEDHTRRQDVLERAGIAKHVLIKNDSFGGLRAGTRRPFGVAIAVGTGTNTCAIAPDGREWAYGYYIYGTGGGGGNIGNRVIRAVLREDDGRGPTTTLTPMVLSDLGYPTVEAMLRAIIAGQLPRCDVLSLCPLAFEAAYEGDEIAAEIIVEEGLIEAEYATGLIRRFGMQDLEFDVVLSGSVFKGKGPLLIDTITQAIHRVAPRARVVRLNLEPAVGALLLAYDALGLAVSEHVYDTLGRSMPAASFFRTVQAEKGAGEIGFRARVGDDS